MADDPELRRLLDEPCRVAELDPLTAVREIMEKVFKLGDGDGSHASLTSRRRARRLDGVARSHAGLPLGDVLAPGRPRRLPEGREPAAHRLVQDPRRGQQDRDASAEAERAAGVVAASAGQPRPGGGLGRARGRDRRRRSSCRRTRRWRRSRRPSTTAPTVELVGEDFDEALAAALRAGRGERRDVRARVRGRARDRRARGRSGSSSPSSCREVETVVVPIGGGGLASGIALALRELTAGRAGRRRPGRSAARRSQARPSTASRSPTESPVKQPGELTAAILARHARRRRHRHRRGDQPGDRAPARAREARRRGRRRRRRGRRAGGPGRAARGRSAPCSRAATSIPTLLISVMRHGLTLAGRYLVVRTRISDRPGELIKLLSLVARGARERDLGRAPPRGHATSGGGDRGRADAGHARPGALATGCSRRCAAGATRSNASAKRRSPGVLTPGHGRWRGCGWLVDSTACAPSPRRERKVVSGALRRPRRLHVARRDARPRGRRGDPCAVPRARCAPSSSASAARWRSSSATRSMAVFGAPVAHEDDAERAVARRPRDPRLGARTTSGLEIRIAVNTGEALVVTRAARPGAARAWSRATSSTPPRASRRRRRSNGILVGEPTYRATRARDRVPRGRAGRGEGQGEPVPVWEAVQARVALRRRRRPRTRTPLVGRERELDRARRRAGARAAGALAPARHARRRPRDRQEPTRLRALRSSRRTIPSSSSGARAGASPTAKASASGRSRRW